MDSDESNVTPFGDAAERLSRREVLGRSGKFVAAAVAVAAFFKGTPAAFARNPSCGSFAGCSCSGGTCYHSGSACPKRFGDCPSGGYCWSEGSTTYCDWWCWTVGSNKCTCSKPRGTAPAGDITGTALAA